MAIYKRKVVRKTYRRRRPKTLAAKAYGMCKYLKKIYKPEIKKRDKAQVSYNVGTTAGVFHVNDIAQGTITTADTRVGNKILCKYVTAKGWIKHNNTATAGQVVKVWLILDKQQIADTTPSAADIFQTPANSATSPLNNETVGRFKILWSKTYVVDPSNEIKPFNLYKRMNIKSWFNGATSSDIQRNGLYIVYASNDNTEFKPELTIQCRTAFTDI